MASSQPLDYTHVLSDVSTYAEISNIDYDGQNDTYSFTINNIVGERTNAADPDPTEFFERIQGQSAYLNFDRGSGSSKYTVHVPKANVPEWERTHWNMSCDGRLANTITWFCANPSEDPDAVTICLQTKLSNVPRGSTSPELARLLSDMRRLPQGRTVDVKLNYCFCHISQAGDTAISCEDLQPRRFQSPESEHFQAIQNSFVGSFMRFTQDPYDPELYLVTTYTEDDREDEHFWMKRDFVKRIKVDIPNRTREASGSIGMLHND
ncbi:hypothetical protein I203_103492 [Kwoniella mangroviensis CBS 8507]|uniref:uncharacterized protein n=1 Tax=Kwoniella mangroviensis CBS 8507 TaxID=1296122 RepID=UPI00080D5FD3|nr:uncharacterized protein I203_04409 [Kwoniella mangroviensis CBS 8507]OCF66831.1 hypothetical protein I203_04409 [Kwoniella mangroviensis CBS 8507]